MRLGMITGGRGETIELNALIQQVVQAEKDGFDNFWFPQVSAGLGFDALTALSLAGAQTSRIGLGAGVIPTYPVHPLTLAKHAMTAQVASGRNTRQTKKNKKAYPRWQEREAS